MKHFMRCAMMLAGLFVATTLFAADKMVVVPLSGVKAGVGKSGLRALQQTNLLSSRDNCPCEIDS